MFLSHITRLPDILYRSLLAVLGKCPGFNGEKQLWNIVEGLENDKQFTLTNKGIWIGVTFRPIQLPILSFVSNKGILVNRCQVSSYIDIRDIVKANNTEVDKEYYRAVALYVFTVLGSIIINALVVINAIHLIISGSTMSAIFSAAWLIPNVFFLIQLYIYHLSKVESIKLQHTFKEAEPDEVDKLFNTPGQPFVLSAIPAYMEEPRLIRNSLYSHCLQRYNNNKIVLLLGNDYYTDKEEVLINTRKNLEVVKSIKNEFRLRDNDIKLKLNVISGKLSAYYEISSVYKEISEIYLSIVKWLEEKRDTIDCDNAFPSKPFLLNHTFARQIAYYTEQAQKCIYQSKFKDNWYFTEHADYHTKQIERYVYECKNFYDIKLEVFQRYKYINTEHERTKAGNLTAYISLLDKEWKEVSTEDGKYKIQIEGASIQLPDYLAIFDSDTILKPDYIIRKVVFMENPENREVGLIQSPYNVPESEPTYIAEASGVHSSWFLPISIGLSSYDSSFWLGYNGLFRYEAVKKIRGSFIADTLIEDIENSLKISQNGYKLITSPEYQCQTFSPQDMFSVHVQRQRWASGGFRIGINYFIDTLNGKYKVGLKTMLMRLNYILSLNLLPLVIAITILLELPDYRTLYYIEVIPFFFYIFTYVECLRKTSYKFRHYFDGLALGIIMNFHYLRGTWTSFKLIFKKESAIVFKSTPRSKTKIKLSLGVFEILGLFTLVFFMAERLYRNFEKGNYYDIYPVYLLFFIIYGIVRLVGYRDFVLNVKEAIRIK